MNPHDIWLAGYKRGTDPNGRMGDNPYPDNSSVNAIRRIKLEGAVLSAVMSFIAGDGSLADIKRAGNAWIADIGEHGER